MLASIACTVSTGRDSDPHSYVPQIPHIGSTACFQNGSFVAFRWKRGPFRPAKHDALKHGALAPARQNLCFETRSKLPTSRAACGLIRVGLCQAINCNTGCCCEGSELRSLPLSYRRTVNRGRGRAIDGGERTRVRANVELLDTYACIPAQAKPKVFVVDQQSHGIRKPIDFTRSYEQAAVSMRHDLRYAADRSRNDRQCPSHGFQQSHRQTLVIGRQHENQRLLEKAIALQCVNPLQKRNGAG